MVWGVWGVWDVWGLWKEWEWALRDGGGVRASSVNEYV